MGGQVVLVYIQVQNLKIKNTERTCYLLLHCIKYQILNCSNKWAKWKWSGSELIGTNFTFVGSCAPLLLSVPMWCSATWSKDLHDISFPLCNNLVPFVVIKRVTIIWMNCAPHFTFLFYYIYIKFDFWETGDFLSIFTYLKTKHTNHVPAIC